MSVSIVIPNYNGKELLAELERAGSLDRAPHENEIIVVDDASTDGSVTFLSEKFPDVKVIPLTKNQGFGEACNIGVATAKNRIIVLLNSDVKVCEDFIPKLTKHFTDSKVFAVQPKVLAWNEESLNGGLNIPNMIYGYFAIENESDRPRIAYVNESGPTFYAMGGAMAFDKIKWEALGGFDNLYAPFCWEDIDISYRVLKRGWKVLYEPNSKVIHKHHATLAKVFAPSYKKRIEQRNEMLFTWKNLHEEDMIAKHFSLLPAHMLYRLFIRNDIGFVLSFLKAAAKIIPVLKRRRDERNYSIVSDSLILQEVTDFYKQWRNKQKDKPRILVLTPFSPYPPSDGGKLGVYNIMKHLSAKYDFHLLTYTWDKDDFPLRLEMEGICKNVDSVPIRKIHRSLFSHLKNILRFPFHYAYYSTDEMEMKLSQIIALYQPDIIQIEFTPMSIYAPLCRRIPTIFMEHDISVISKHSYFRPLKGWQGFFEYFDRYYRLISWEKRVCKMVSCVVTVTDADREILSKLSPRTRVETVASGTDLEHFSMEYKENINRNILFVGSMGHFPNPDAVLYFYKEIFPRIKEEIPSVTFTIVGSGSNPEVSSLAKDPSIRVTGYVEDIRPYIENAEIFVAPMRKGAGMKGKILQAMAMSKPIVTTSIGAQGIRIEPENDFLLADNPEQFARQVIRLFRDPDLKHRLAVNANRICRKHYDWKIRAARMDEIYKSLLEKEK